MDFADNRVWVTRGYWSHVAWSPGEE
jgi:hypothetical protein